MASLAAASILPDLAALWGARALADASGASADVVDAALNGLPPGAAQARDGEDADGAAKRVRALLDAADDVAGRINAALDAACAEAASAVAVRYLWSDASEAPLVRQVVSDLAVGALYGGALPESLEPRMAMARRMLADLRGGASVLTDADGTPLAEAGAEGTDGAVGAVARQPRLAELAGY